MTLTNDQRTVLAQIARHGQWVQDLAQEVADSRGYDVEDIVALLSDAQNEALEAAKSLEGFLAPMVILLDELERDKELEEDRLRDEEYDRRFYLWQLKQEQSNPKEE